MSTLYLCHDCGKWRVLNFMELFFVQNGDMKATCPDCNIIMYNVQPEDKLELMEEEEEEFHLVSPLQPFDAARVFDAEQYKDNRMMQDAKNWIVFELQKPLEDVTKLRIENTPIDTGVRDLSIPAFYQGPYIHFFVTFKDEDGEHARSFERAKYVTL